MGDDESILEVLNVHAGYGEIVVLRGVSISLRPGTITSIIGANGAGKSTLLKTVFGTVKPTLGTIRYLGQDITTWSSSERLRHGISLIPQGRSNFPLMTVYENLEMGAYTRHDRAVSGDISAMIQRFPILESKRRELAGNLSGGEQQVLEMAMSLLLAPKIALVDEPSLGLAPNMQRIVFDSIQRLRDIGTTVLMVEQNAVQALRISDAAVVLELGQAAAAGTGPEMLQDPEVRRAYLGLPEQAT